jgi:transketolase
MTYQDLLLELSEKNPDLLVMTAENRAVIRQLPDKLGKRFIDVGICEQTMVGAAAGLALRGRVPLVHALATFLVFRAYEFIRDDVGIAGLPVKLMGYVPGFLSVANGPTHQAIEDIALMRGIPGMQVFCPADSEELLTALPQIVDSGKPCYVRYNDCPKAVEHTAPFTIGQAEQLGDGSDLTLLTYGFLLEQVVAAKTKLEERGHSVRVLNMRSLAPVDEAAILTAAEQTRLLVTVEDHFLVGGLASIVAETLMRARKAAAVETIALDARFFAPLMMADLLEQEGFTAEQIANSAQKALESL